LLVDCLRRRAAEERVALVSVEVNASEVAALVARGYLPEGAGNDPAAINTALEGVISDMAFELQQEIWVKSASRL
jgi:hypothetical protein